MKDNTVPEIIRLCQSIDKKAEVVYISLAENFQSQEIALFWQEMAAQEREHTIFWKKLLDLAEQGMIPQVFDQPHQVVNELKIIDRDVDDLIDGCCKNYQINESFILSYRLEFYLLHPALETFFQYGKMLEESLGLDSPVDHYESHISQFIEALNKYGKVTPEMELVGETLKTLWEENRKLGRLINQDQLTGVLNRRGFFQAITPLAHLAKRNGFKVGLLMIDLDHFKDVNDTFGHQVGDKVLVSVASAIVANTRASDLVGRYGGEEFVVFLPKVREDGFIQVAEKIRRAVHSVKPQNIDITVSIGGDFGRINDVDREIQDLIKRADDRLYLAKNKGRNNVVCG